MDRLSNAAAKSSLQAPATVLHDAAQGGEGEQKQQRVASVAVRVTASGDVGSSGNGDRNAKSFNRMSSSSHESAIGSSQGPASVPRAHERQTVNAKEASPQSSPTRGNEVIS